MFIKIEDYSLITKITFIINIIDTYVTHIPIYIYKIVDIEKMNSDFMFI